MIQECKYCSKWLPRGVEPYIAMCSLDRSWKTIHDTCELWECISTSEIRRTDEVTSKHTKRVSNRTVSRDRDTTANELSKEAVTDRALYEHQLEVVEYAKTHDIAALFWDPGVGKSAAALSVANLKYQEGKIDSLLIVSKNEVHRQWAAEQIPMWIKVPYQLQCLYGRGGQKIAYAFDNDDRLQIVVTNIDTFSQPTKWQDIANWAMLRKTMFVLDESTVIKNLTAKRTQHILYEFNDIIKVGKSIKSNIPKTVCRMILTGTPVTNGSLDLYPMMEFLQPGFFGRNYYSFKYHYGMFTQLAVNDRVLDVPLTEEWWNTIKGIQSYAEAKAVCGCSEDTFNTIHAQDKYQGPYKHADELKALLAPVAFFKRLEECEDMPPQNYIVRNVIMSDEQRQCYDSMVDEYIAQYAGATATALNKLSLMIRLQQISSGFLSDKELLNSSEEDDPLKLMYGIDDVDLEPKEVTWIGDRIPKMDMMFTDLEGLSKPVIVATRYTAEAARIYEELSQIYKCCLMTGWKKVGSASEFQEGKYDVMVANSSVISHGFNLQNSNAITIYSNTFSLETRLQLEGRIFRLGQKRPCFYYDYLNEDSIDNKVITSLRLKLSLLDFIRDTGIKELLTLS